MWGSDRPKQRERMRETRSPLASGPREQRRPGTRHAGRVRKAPERNIPLFDQSFANASHAKPHTRIVAARECLLTLRRFRGQAETESLPANATSCRGSASDSLAVPPHDSLRGARKILLQASRGRCKRTVATPPQPVCRSLRCALGRLRPISRQT